MTGQRRLVTAPYQDSRDRVSSGGERPWRVTVTTGDVVTTHKDWSREEVAKHHAAALANGHEEV